MDYINYNKINIFKNLDIPKNVNTNWATYIKEWISIYNVANDIDKKYLQELGENEIEKCGFDSDEMCLDNKEIECSIYKSTCVSKKRIKKWRDNKEHLSKDKSILYKLLGVKELKLLYFHSKIYYYKYLSSLTQNILIMFPTGTTQIVDLLFVNSDLNIFIEELLDNIISAHTNNQKYIFCGHSMGSILAFYAGYRMKEKNPVFFDNHCIVIGSGHFKWIPETDTSFTNLHNVRAYVYGEIHEKNELILDTYYNLQFEGKTHYSPSTYLIKKNNTEFIELTDITQYTINYSSQLHTWYYYLNAFEYLYILNRKKVETKKADIYLKKNVA